MRIGNKPTLGVLALALALAAPALADGISSTPVTAAAVIGACGASTGQLLYDNAGVCAGLTSGTNGQLPIGQTGAAPVFTTITQDCSLTAGGVITCTKTNNVAFTAGATAAVGQLPGTTTNDNASAGNVGEIMSSSCPSAATTATVTITIAAPGVITWTAHGFTTACPVVFTTTGTLPTGITSGTVYYVVPSSVTANTFTIATTIANALAGTQITTTGSQSGTQTGTAGAAEATTVALGLTGLALTAGDWDCVGQLTRGLAASTSVTLLKTSINTSIADGSAQNGNMAIFGTAANVMANDHTEIVGPFRISISSTTNYFLVGDDTFTVSTNKTYGTLRCRRMR